MLAGAALALALTLGTPRVSVSRTSGLLAKVKVSGIGARLSGLKAMIDGHPVVLVAHAGGFVPARPIAQGEVVELHATAMSPSWLGWLVGRKVSATMTLESPASRPTGSVVLASSSGELPVHFDQPVSAIEYRFAGGPAHTEELSHPSAVVDIPAPKESRTGSLVVSDAPLPWETPEHPTSLTWFVPPAGGGPMAIVSPAPGSASAAPDTPITLEFSEPVHELLGTSLPKVSPAVPGHWSQTGPNGLRFTPSGFGFGPDTPVTVDLGRPVSFLAQGASTGTTAGAQTAASTSSAPATSFHFSTGAGSLLRLDQLLAELHYLPLRFVPAPGVSEPTTLAGEMATISHPLAGSFTWRFASAPASLRADWAPGVANEMLKGALMSFVSTLGNYDGYVAVESSVDQLANGTTWEALIRDALAHRLDPSGYSYVHVDQQNETLTLWENGKVVLTSPTNTGIAASPTANGLFAVYIRFVENTMSGTNPNGTHYDDLVHWINYFNGGDAIHYFPRAGYGFPQSLGCAELPMPAAEIAFDHLAIGDLVSVTG